MHMGMVGSWRIAATETDVGHGEPIIDCTAEYVEASGVAELLSELGEVQRAIAE